MHHLGADFKACPTLAAKHLRQQGLQRMGRMAELRESKNQWQAPLNHCFYFERIIGDRKNSACNSTGCRLNVDALAGENAVRSDRHFLEVAPDNHVVRIGAGAS